MHNQRTQIAGRHRIESMWRSRLSPAAGLLIGTMIATGCTAVPHQDFTAYRQAFAEAREASTPVINDLGLAWLDAEAVEPTNDETNDEGWQQFDPAAPSRPLTIDEQVMLRHQLWVVTGRYNEALAALAEGRSPEQVEGLVNGFLNSVRELPFRRLADLAAGAQPLSGLIGETMMLVEREVRARQFHRAVEAGAPLVDAILAAMQEEIGDHYNLRLVLNTRSRRNLQADVQLQHLPAFLDIYESTGPHDGKLTALNDLNDALRDRFRYREHQLLDPSDDEAESVPSPSELAQLASIADNVVSKSRQYVAYKDELRHYQHVLQAYHELLEKTRQRTAALLHAIEYHETVAADDVLLASINLYWQFTKYRNARANR